MYEWYVYVQLIFICLSICIYIYIHTYPLKPIRCFWPPGKLHWNPTGGITSIMTKESNDQRVHLRQIWTHSLAKVATFHFTQYEWPKFEVWKNHLVSVYLHSYIHIYIYVHMILWYGHIIYTYIQIYIYIYIYIYICIYIHICL